MRLSREAENLKNEILSRDYSLSVALVSEKKSREINRIYRKKDEPTNVLSFALSKNSGELLLCKPLIRREAKKINRSFSDWLRFLVIHGLLHLKGMRHGSTMERLEKLYDEKYRGGNRLGLFNGKSRGRRVHQGRKKSEDNWPG